MMKGETSEIFIESDKLNCCLTDKAKPKFFHAVLYAENFIIFRIVSLLWNNKDNWKSEC